jgi:hypothetical protein
MKWCASPSQLDLVISNRCQRHPAGETLFAQLPADGFVGRGLGYGILAMPALGSADCFHDLSAATAVRAGPTVNAPAAMTVRADILARPGCSARGLIARIEHLTGIGCMHPDPCTSAFVLRVLRVVLRHSCLLYRSQRTDLEMVAPDG